MTDPVPDPAPAPDPIPTHRVVAGLAVPLTLLPRLVKAIRAEYLEAVVDFPDDDDAAVQAALLQWMTDTLVNHEVKAAREPLVTTVARAVADFEAKANQAKERALDDASTVVRTPTAPTYT